MDKKQAEKILEEVRDKISEVIAEHPVRLFVDWDGEIFLKYDNGSTSTEIPLARDDL